MTTHEFSIFREQYAGEPVLFFFRVAVIDREELKRGITRRECITKSHTAIPLSEFDTAWNDTDGGLDADNGPRIYIPDPKDSWCYVSMPEEGKDGDDEEEGPMKDALDYVRSQLDEWRLDEYRAAVRSAYEYHTTPTAYDDFDHIRDLLEEYGRDNGLDEDWWESVGDLDEWLYEL